MPQNPQHLHLVDPTNPPAPGTIPKGSRPIEVHGTPVGGGGGGANPSNSNPAMNGSAAPGTNPNFSRGDHVHPSDTSRLSTSGGTVSGAIVLPAAMPTLPAQAAHKGYVDSAVASVGGADVDKAYVDAGLAAERTQTQADVNTRLPLAGGTLTGPLVLPAAPPTLANHATNKAYVDGAVSAGGSFVDAPVDGQLYGRKDAGWETVPAAGGPPPDVDKAYVDAALAAERAATTADVATRLALTGGTLTGPIVLPSAPPTLPDHAASKVYVDGAVSAGGSFVDAPIDGEMYARKDAAWEVIPATAPGGIADAPVDGLLYARKDADWEEIQFPTPGIGEAPADGEFYARKDNAWEVPPPALPEPAPGLNYWRSSGAWVADPLQADAPSDGLDYVRRDGAWEEVPPCEVHEAPQDGTFYARKDAGWEADPIQADAPSDSLEYARKDGAWVKVTASAGINDAPTDGAVYARKDGAWAETPIQADCPGDGQIYSRLQGRWEPNVIQSDAPSDGSQYVREAGSWQPLPAGGLPEAPLTGNFWARNNGNWGMVPIQDDAPVDGKPYARVDAAWAEVDPGTFVDSPQNGMIFARKDGTWEEVPVQDDAPADGKDYVRKDGGWEHLDLPNMVEEPPDDGKVYGRTGGIVASQGGGIVGGAWNEVMPLSGGVMTGPLKLAASPSDPMEAIPKGYADTGISNMLALSVQKSGGTNAIMTGHLTLPVTAPTDPRHAVSKQWVEDELSSQPPPLPLAGGTMLGDIDMAGRKLVNLIAPTADSDPATKEYVDNVVTSPSAYQGTWRCNENLPDLRTPALQVNGNYWIVQTTNEAPTPPPVALPGVPTTFPLFHGDWLVWSDFFSQWQIMRGGMLSQAAADIRYLKLAGGTVTGQISFGGTLPIGITWEGGSTRGAIYSGTGVNGDLVLRRPQSYDIILEESQGGSRSPILSQARADARYDSRYVPLNGSRQMEGSLSFPSDQSLGVLWGRGNAIYEGFPTPNLIIRPASLSGGRDADVLIQSPNTGLQEKVLTVQTADARYDQRYYTRGGGELTGSVFFRAEAALGVQWGRGSAIYEAPVTGHLVLQPGVMPGAKVHIGNSPALSEATGDARYIKSGVGAVKAADVDVSPTVANQNTVQRALEVIEARAVNRNGDEILGSLTIVPDGGGLGFGPSAQQWPGGIIQRQGNDMLFRRGQGSGDLYRTNHDGSGRSKLATVDDVAAIGGGPYLRTNIDGILYGINLTLASESGISDGSNDTAILFGRYGGMRWYQGVGFVFQEGQVGAGYGHLYVAHWDDPINTRSRVLDETYADARYNARYVAQSGGVMTGALTVPAPTSAGHAANQGWCLANFTPIRELDALKAEIASLRAEVSALRAGRTPPTGGGPAPRGAPRRGKAE